MAQALTFLDVLLQYIHSDRLMLLDVPNFIRK